MALMRLFGFAVSMQLIKFFASEVTVSHSGDGYWNHIAFWLSKHYNRDMHGCFLVCVCVSPRLCVSVCVLIRVHECAHVCTCKRIYCMKIPYM